MLRIIEANRRRHTLAMDDAVPAVERLWGLVRARVVDELTGLSPQNIRIETPTHGFTPRVTADGIAGLMARPAHVFPRLAEQAYPVSFTLHVDDYLPHEIHHTFQANPAFPVRTLRANALMLDRVDGFVAGTNFTLNPGGPNEEDRVIAGVDPGNRQILFTLPFANPHAVGEIARLVHQVGMGGVAANSHQIPMNSTVGFLAGDVLIVEPGSARQETVTVAQGGIAPNAITTVDSLIHGHAAGIEVIHERVITSVGTGIGAPMLFLESVDGIFATDTLYVGRPGVVQEAVTVQFVVGAEARLEVAPQLSRRHAGGAPVVVARLTPFDPASIVDDRTVGLHRPPTVIEGQTFRRHNGGAEPVPALVEVTGLWRHLVPAAQEGPPDQPFVVSLTPPLYFARTQGIAQLQPVTVLDVLGDDKALLDWTHAGEDQLRLSNTLNLHLGTTLLIDTDPERQEYVTIAEVPPGASVASTVTLTHPLAHTHRPETRVRPVLLLPPGPPRTFDDDAIAGDTCVFLDDTAGLEAPNLVVEVVGGAAPDGTPLPNELHWLGFFRTTSDAEGRYRLPPLSRVAQLQLRATAALAFDHDVGDPVVTTRRLLSDPTPNLDTTITLDSLALINPGDLLIVGMPGAQEVREVAPGGVNALADEVTFTEPLGIDHEPDDLVVLARRLVSDPVVGASTITLDSLALINPGDLLIVGMPGAQEVREVAPGGVNAGAGAVTFTAPLGNNHAPGAPVVPARRIAVEPAVGDNAVTLDDANGILDGHRLIVGRPGRQEVMEVVNNPVNDVVTFTAGDDVTFIPNYPAQVSHLDIEF